MIVITGPGRSGTSFLARLYQELGFDPGGRWEPAVNAGFEAPQVRAKNLELADELGVSIKERRGGRVLRLLGAAVDAVGERRPKAVGRALTNMVDPLRYRSKAPDLMRFDVVEDVARRRGDELRTIAEDFQVVKDPRLCFTLRAWLASGVPVQSVVLTLRPLNAMADSRVRARMYSTRAREWGKNNYCYGLGLLLTAAAEYRVPVVTLRFPDFLDDADELYRLLPLPEPRTREEFEVAFHTVFEPTLVHDRR